MEENIRTIREKIKYFDTIVGPHFGWQSHMYDDYTKYKHKEDEPKKRSSYQDWVANISSYKAISIHLNDEMCTSTVRDKNTNELVTVSHTLASVLMDMYGTPMESEFRKTMMLCIYTDLDIKLSIRPFLIQLYG